MRNEGLIQTLHLTINHSATGENNIDLKDLVKSFRSISSEKIGDDEFLRYELL